MTDDMASCDCCGEMVPRDDIRVVIAYGIETGACSRCRGVEPEPDEGDQK
jgi:Zn-finger nucleic acid-binding protein